MKKSQSFSTLYTIVCSLLLFAVFFNIYLTIYKEIPIRYWDEHGWIARTYYFDLLIRGDIHNSLWKTTPSYVQPKLTEYLYGVALYPQYLAYSKTNPVDFVQFLIDHNFYRLSSPKYSSYRTANSNYIHWGKYPANVFDISDKELISRFGERIKPTINLIYQARAINSIVLSLAVVVVYILTRAVSNNIIAVLTSIFFGSNYLFITAGLRAHSEGLFLLLFFSSLCVLLLSFHPRKVLFWQSIILGVLIALTTQTKLNGVMVFMYTNIVYAFLFIQSLINKNRQGMIHSIITVCIITCAFVVTFIAVHPYLYERPVENTMQLFRYRNFLADVQTTQFAKQYLDTYPERLSAVYKHFIIDPAEHCHYNGLYYTNKKMCSSNWYFYMKMFFFFAGVGFFTLQAFATSSRKKLLFFSSFIFFNIITALYLTLDWDRYYVHFIYYFVFFQVYGLVSLLYLFHKNLSKNYLYSSLIKA